MPLRIYTYSHHYMALLAILAGITTVYLYHAVQHETGSSQMTLLDLPDGTAQFAIVAGKDPSRCVGSITTTAVETDGQIEISSRAWIALDLSGTRTIQEGSGKLIFNALKQLGASFAEIVINGTSVRLGTRNINPLSLAVYVGNDNSPPLIEQNVPGPITVERTTNRLRVTAPLIRQTTSLAPRASDLASLAPLSLKEQPCERTDHDYLPISVEALKALSSRFSGAPREEK